MCATDNFVKNILSLVTPNELFSFTETVIPKIQCKNSLHFIFNPFKCTCVI